jgi:hypothetical protein
MYFFCILSTTAPEYFDNISAPYIKLVVETIKKPIINVIEQQRAFILLLFNKIKPRVEAVRVADIKSNSPSLKISYLSIVINFKIFKLKIESKGTNDINKSNNIQFKTIFFIFIYPFL